MAIVVTYNRLSKLRSCIAALRASVSPVDILVVNNASTDETSCWLATEADGRALQVLSLPENIGGAGGFNKGARWAVEHGYAYAWLMDDDCYVSPTALSTFLDADRLLKGNYGWLSSVVLWTNGKTCMHNRQRIDPDFHIDLDKLPATLLAARQATFVSLFVKTNIIRQVGLPIKDFFIWGDDDEFTRRISTRTGKRCYVVGASTVTHDVASNEGVTIANYDFTKLQRFALYYRNQFYSYRQEGIRGIAFYLARTGFHFLKALFLSQDHRLLRCWTIIKGFGEGLVFSPKIEFVDEKE